MAKPIEASAAATVRINIVKTWPTRSPKKIENATKFIFTAAKIIARNPKILDVSKTTSEEPAKAAIIAPTIITDEIALVTDIRGV